MNDLTTRKTENPADGSPCWAVIGFAGRVAFDALGNHLSIKPTWGDTDAVLGSSLARVKEYAELGDDDALFAVLADLYKTELEFEAIVETSFTDRRCRTCGATSGLILLTGNPLAVGPREYECVDGCKDGAK